MKKLNPFIFLLALALIPFHGFSWPGMPTPVLRVSGRDLVDPCGNKVVLHGVAITPHPWFNGCQYGTCRWDNFNVTGCLNYNKAVMDRLTNTQDGGYLNYIRLHIDPYWTNNGTATGEDDISKFDYNKFVAAVNNVIVPLIDHAKARGMYVILRPPGVCPRRIDVNDAYYTYLMTVWQHLSTHPRIKNADHVMFELANEPIEILGTNGVWGGNTQAHFDKLKLFFQPIVNKIRTNGANNVVWIPGTGWQSEYKGYANNPITGGNIGYAVHIYPGYWGQDNNNPTVFRNNWNANIKPVANFAPIAITEINWAPQGYGTWGVGTTGTAGQTGFGANFKALADESGNVSWNLLNPDDLIDKGNPTGGIAFNNDPQACANPCFNWFRAYATANSPASACNLINNGVYEIEFQTDPGKVLDLMNGSDTNGALVRPWTRLGGTPQQWKAISLGNNYWRFVSMASPTGRVLDLTGATTANNTAIKLWESYSNDAQAWQVTSVGGGYYKVLSRVAVNQGLNRGWDIAGCSMTGTAGLQLYDNIPSSCQKFKFNYLRTSARTTVTAEEEQLAPVSFSIYPNPSGNGNFTISIPELMSDNLQLGIYRVDGRNVFEHHKLMKGSNYIKSGLTKGIYIIKIQSGKQTYNKKLVIE